MYGGSSINLSSTGCGPGVPELAGSATPGVGRIGNSYLGLLADSSRDDWHILVAGQTHETCENSPQFPRFPRQQGHLRSPPHYLLHQTVPDSSSGFCSSKQSNPTTTVGSPPLPRKINPRSRSPNCSGDGGINTICLLKLVINQHSVWPVAYYSQLRAYSQANTDTKSLLMYTYFNTLYPQNLSSLYSQHVCCPQKLAPCICFFSKTRETP